MADIKNYKIVFLGAKAPQQPTSSEGLYVCLYVCMYVCNILTPLPSPFKGFNFLG